MKKINLYIKNLYLLIILLTLGLLNFFTNLSQDNKANAIYSFFILVAILGSVVLLFYQNKIYAGRAIRQNKRLKAALKAGNLTLVTLNLTNMTIEQETPFSYDGEAPESFGGPIDFYDLIDQIIHPQDHHVIRDTIHEFRHEGVEELHVDLRVIHFGEWLWFRFYMSLDTPKRLVLLGQMIHQQRKVNEELYHKANFDALTNLVNRHFCHSYLEKILEQKRRKDFPMTIAYIDADSLKEVNDMLGHSFGDQYLRDISRVLTMGIRDDDILGRIGGDEFLLVCPQTSEMDFISIESRIEKERLRLNNNPQSVYELSFSLGFIQITGLEDYTVDQLIQEADKRMYQVKKSKKSQGRGVRVVK